MTQTVPLDSDPFAVAVTLALFCPLQVVFGWGHKGHQVIGLIAEHSLTPGPR